MVDDAEILAVFQEESATRLDRMVETLLALEAKRPSPGAIDSLFRDAHSIKGSAGMLGLREAGTIAHAIEDALQDARERESFATDLADPLLRATDALRNVIFDGAGVDDSAIARLLAATSRSHAPAPVRDGAVEDPAVGVRNGCHAGGADTALVNGAAPLVEAPVRAEATAPPRPSPRPSIRTSTETVDRLLDVVGETVQHTRRLEHLLTTGERQDERVQEELGRGELLLDELQDSVIQMRTLPLSSITSGFPRAVRDLAIANSLEVELEITGAETRLDRVILEGISEAIGHLLRNAVAHGIEAPDERERAGKPACGRLALRAEQRGSLVAIELSDDGRGVAPELLAQVGDGRPLADLLAQAGVSTATTVTDVSGRGVGMDAVKAYAESLGGGLQVASEPGVGTTVTVMLPMTLALLRVLLLDRGGQIFALPLTSVEEVLIVSDTQSLGGSASIALRGRSITLADLAQIVGAKISVLPEPPAAVVVSSFGRRIALLCDRIVEEQEVVVKSLGALLSGVSGYLGAAILHDGTVALILDPAAVVKTEAGARGSIAGAPDRLASKVLVVDDQFTVRELQRSILEAAGYRVATARDGRDAIASLAAEGDVGLIVTDLDMPEMDGIELLRHVRADAERSTLPVVVVSGRGSTQDRQRGVDEGADAYIVKDEFDQRTLLDTVARLLAP
jgi:two-component system chemotaxis sensor kinase CheA